MMNDKYPTRKSDTFNLVKRTSPITHTSDSLYGLREYGEQGYFHFRNFFCTDDIESARESSEAITNGSLEHEFLSKEPRSDKLRSALNIHNIPAFSKLRNNHILRKMSNAILGSDNYIHQSRINYKNSYGAAGWDWHSDFETWHSQDGMPDMRAFSAMIPLTENTHENGCLMVVPKSHTTFCSCAGSSEELTAESEFSEQKEGIPPPDALNEIFKTAGPITPILCNPGDLVLFDCNLLHVSNTNLTPSSRSNLFFVLNSVENHLVEPFAGGSPRPEYMAHRSAT